MEFRLIKETELTEAALLAEDVFCGNGERYMERSFPTIFQSGMSQSYAAFNEQGKLVSFIGMVPFIVRSGVAFLNAYSIGAVCTDPAYRGQGIAGKLFTLCQQHAKEAGASLMFISGDRSLYTRAGSVAFGETGKYIIESHVAERVDVQPSPWTISEMEPKDLCAVHSLMMHKSATIHWSINDLAQFIGASPMANIHKMDQHIVVARTETQEIVAIAIVAAPRNPSSEEAGILIEYAGPDAAVIELLLHSIRQFELQSLSVTIPWQDVELANRLQAADVSVERQNNAGTVLVIDGEALITQAGYEESDTNQLSISVLPDGRYKLHTPQKSSVIGGNAELCSLLFDPHSSIEQPGDNKIPTIALPYLYGLYFI